ncbi:MAG: DUF362 domain-containing protein [Rhodothermales bacterium]|nr:DUF362 domain-containing protein [Rhodothermales bacterium]
MAASQPIRACVCLGGANDLAAHLARTLEDAGFWEILDGRRGEKVAAAFRIVIKPDLEVFATGGSTGTDPALVEALIEQLVTRGYETVSVVDGPSPAGVWLENRDVLALADLAGYRFETASGHPYDIADLGEDLADAGFPAGSVLAGTPLGAAWLEADFRILVPKLKTDEEERFALGAHTLLGVLPLRDKDLHYRCRLDAGDVAVALLQHTPVHFSIIDGRVANHGSQGMRASKPFPAGMLIASSDALLADWAGALKMGLDPYASRLNARALHTIGLPASYEIAGDLAPMVGWLNPSLLLADAVRARNKNPTLRRHVAPWITTVDTALFPFKQGLDAQVNGYLAPLLAEVDEQPFVAGAYLALNGLLASIEQGLYAWRITADKGRLRRREVPLGIDLSRFQPADFDAVAQYILPLADIARHTPPDANGLRWRYIDGSVLFEYRRILPISFDRFVDRVDIAAAVEMMYDNIGGARVTVQQDEQGRIVHQAERNIYLPQPNWMVFFGGEDIDVGKIEVVRYEADRRRIFWRAVESANGSAAFDDGLVAFSRHGDDVEILIVARQKFALPLFWQAINMDYLPEIKARMVSDAYIAFFSRTVANYEAAYEGRDTRTGHALATKDDEDGRPLAIEQIDELLAMLMDFLRRWAQPTKGGPTKDGQATASTDAMGYRHLPGKAAAEHQPALWRELAEAMQRDMRRMTGTTDTSS